MISGPIICTPSVLSGNLNLEKSFPSPSPVQEIKEIKKEAEPAELQQNRQIKPKVLIVNDKKDEILMMSKYLDDEQYKIFSLSDPEQTIVKVRDLKPQLIIMDLKMVKINTFTLIPLLQSFLNTMTETKDTKILIVSAFTNESVIKKLSSMHITHLLKKPFTSEVLNNKIKQIMDKTP